MKDGGGDPAGGRAGGTCPARACTVHMHALHAVPPVAASMAAEGAPRLGGVLVAARAPHPRCKSRAAAFGNALSTSLEADADATPAEGRQSPLALRRTAILYRVLQDYCIGLTRLAEHADYIVVNVSSPNTPGGWVPCSAVQCGTVRQHMWDGGVVAVAVVTAAAHSSSTWVVVVQRAAMCTHMRGAVHCRRLLVPIPTPFPPHPPMMQATRAKSAKEAFRLPACLVATPRAPHSKHPLPPPRRPHALHPHRHGSWVVLDPRSRQACVRCRAARSWRLSWRRLVAGVRG